jgi:hypothetical protein
MGGMQTILALLAVTLFSSLTLGSFNNLTQQGDIIYVSYLNLLGQNEAEAFFDSLNCQIISGSMSLTQLYNNFHNVHDTVTIIDLPTSTSVVTFNRNITTDYCNLDGSHSATPTDYVSVSLIMSSSYGSRAVSVGTASNPIVRYYTSSGL